MKDISYVDDFTPSCAGLNNISTQSSEPQKAFIVGAGVQDGEIFQAAAQRNLTVVGGSNVVGRVRSAVSVCFVLNTSSLFRMLELQAGPWEGAMAGYRASLAWEPTMSSRQRS